VVASSGARAVVASTRVLVSSVRGGRCCRRCRCRSSIPCGRRGVAPVACIVSGLLLSIVAASSALRRMSAVGLCTLRVSHIIKACTRMICTHSLRVISAVTCMRLLIAVACGARSAVTSSRGGTVSCGAVARIALISAAALIPCALIAAARVPAAVISAAVLVAAAAPVTALVAAATLIPAAALVVASVVGVSTLRRTLTSHMLRLLYPAFNLTPAAHIRRGHRNIQDRLLRTRAVAGSHRLDQPLAVGPDSLEGRSRLPWGMLF
jgi:hypothetical protein